MSSATTMHLPHLATGNESLDKAFRMALGDLAGNILPFAGGLLAGPRPVVIAGLDYTTPWTRDAAINSWFAATLLAPDVARNTLLSVLANESGRLEIGGEYWDCVIWAWGAWNQSLATPDDREFLELAFAAVTHTLSRFEKEELDSASGLFRGGACFQDGIAGYPDFYAAAGCTSGIADWPKRNPPIGLPGRGLPMLALSTNCLYVQAYRAAAAMGAKLGETAAATALAEKAGALRRAVNAAFWDEARGNYLYMLGPHGRCEHQEGLGSAFAILCGVADAEQTRRIMETQHVTPAGIPCVWPTFPRYSAYGPGVFGRHSGTVWPQVQGFWALAALKAGAPEKFGHELFTLAGHANRDAQFTEIYHPETGGIYGGIQEAGDRGVVLWDSCRRQTWSATALLAMVLRGVCGMEFADDGLAFNPCLPDTLGGVSLQGLRVGGAELDIRIKGRGRRLADVEISGRKCERGRIPWETLSKAAKPVTVRLQLA